ncbi:hypothetical protein K438DRAFT_1992885 [Mycena galopus ATCC 62051]|nr:hypothetical protein K438DRAFT_1992885 [Mycena galopus ATCC 62051]
MLRRHSVHHARSPPMHSLSDITTRIRRLRTFVTSQYPARHGKIHPRGGDAATRRRHRGPFSATVQYRCVLEHAPAVGRKEWASPCAGFVARRRLSRVVVDDAGYQDADAPPPMIDIDRS